jgi:hypothetical protein
VEHADVTAQLWVAGPLPSLNDWIAAAKGSGGRGAGYARLKRQWTETVWALAKQARLPRFVRPVQLVFLWRERDKRRDKDNVAAGGRKPIMDGLVDAGVLLDDDWNGVDSWIDQFAIDAAAPGCLVTIAEEPPF